MACFFEKRFHHVSDKGNDVHCYDIHDGMQIIATVFSANVAKHFCKAVDIINSKALPHDAKSAALVTLLHVVHHVNNKLEGLDSISTSCLKNPICLARMQTDSICKHCYAASQQAMQHGLDDNNALNAYILQNHLFDSSEIALLSALPMWTQYARIESFGDVANVTQAVNYLRIIKAHPMQHYAIWSKNLAIWAMAFQVESKPENTTFVQSSIMLNKRDERFADWVDHIFTVWSDEKTAAENGVSISCGGRKCRTCLRCYHADTGLYVDELKK